MDMINTCTQSFAEIVLLDCSPLQEETLFERFFQTMDNTRKNKITSSRGRERLTSLGVGLLSGYLMDKYRIDRSALSFAEGGKPHIQGDTYYLSLSHAGYYAMAALSSAPIGIDIERLDAKHEKIASHFFRKEELEYLQQHNEENSAFFAIWCRKECMIKRDGFKDLRDLPVFCIAEDTQFMDFAVQGHACVAYVSKDVPVSFQTRTLDELKIQF